MKKLYIPKNYVHSFYILLLSIAFSVFHAEARQDFVTYGSAIKLFNIDYRVRLHSHDVKYGTGSGQQSVTGTKIQEDINSHWIVKGPAKKYYLRGNPVPCGSIIRLEHIETKKNLHSHLFSSPLSGNQEISAYGDEKGEGDSGDNWTVICSGTSWRRDESVMLKHVDTQAYLAVSGKSFGRPINGQLEVIGLRTSSGAVHWETKEGVYLHAPDIKQHVHIHSEL